MPPVLLSGQIDRPVIYRFVDRSGPVTCPSRPVLAKAWIFIGGRSNVNADSLEFPGLVVRVSSKSDGLWQQQVSIPETAPLRRRRRTLTMAVGSRVWCYQMRVADVGSNPFPTCSLSNPGSIFLGYKRISFVVYLISRRKDR